MEVRIRHLKLLLQLADEFCLVQWYCLTPEGTPCATALLLSSHRLRFIKILNHPLFNLFTIMIHLLFRASSCEPSR